jgi:hypothetical protein
MDLALDVMTPAGEHRRHGQTDASRAGQSADRRTGGGLQKLS